MENAIANHEFEKARFYSDEERKERENLRQLREKYNLDDTSTGVVTKDDIEDVVARWTGVPMTAIKEEEIAKLLRIEEELHKRIISQEKAISALARAIRRSRAGLEVAQAPGRFVPVPGAHRRRQDRSRPRAGRVPVRQREVADPLRHVRVHGEALGLEADRFASGLRGLRRGRPAHRARQAHPYSIILLDEIEKAHPDVYNILLQVFEDGQLTDGLGNTVDFKNTIIIMTSNLGARFLDKKRGNWASRRRPATGIPPKVEDMVMGEVKRAFNPEFLNRLDEVILFTSLTDDDLIKIIDLLVDQINVNLVAKQIKIRLTRDAAKYILEKTCARPQLRRASAAPRAAEVHRGSAVGGAHPGLAAAAGRARSLPRRHRHLLPSGDANSRSSQSARRATNRRRCRGPRCICSRRRLTIAHPRACVHAAGPIPRA